MALLFFTGFEGVPDNTDVYGAEVGEALPHNSSSGTYREYYDISPATGRMCLQVAYQDTAFVKLEVGNNADTFIFGTAMKVTGDIPTYNASYQTFRLQDASGNLHQLGPNHRSLRGEFCPAIKSLCKLTAQHPPQDRHRPLLLCPD